MPSKEEKALQQKIANLEKQITRLQYDAKKREYGLVWMDVPEAFEDDVENKLPILREVPNKAIVNDDEKPTHILIEGDNYHTLTCLNYTHKGKIDLIYIDPPYNTGEDGFRYKDKRVLVKYPDGSLVPKDHPLRHSYWLSFMFKRLDLAKHLLNDKGVIFISINEEELYSLKLLCDQLFNVKNYLACFTIKVRHEDRILKGDKDFHEVVEYLLMYRKSKDFQTIKRLQDNTSISDYVFEIEELEGKPKIITLGTKQVEVFKPGQFQIHKGEPSEKKFKKINIRGSIKEGNSSGRFHMKYLEEKNNLLGYLYKVPGIGDDEVPYRYFLTRAKKTNLNGHYFQGVPTSKTDIKEVPYPNYLDFEEAFNNVGYEGGVEFRNGKKPVDFLKFIFKIGSLRKDIVILDFFAGSASTGHAVMEQNSIDGGNRQVILCTNNEENIAHEVTYPRLQNVINGYQQTKNKKEILFELSLNSQSVVNNNAILEARDKFFQEKYINRYDEIKEEIRKDRYIIYGVIKKSSKTKGFGNSLKYYKTDFVGKNSILNPTDEDKIALAYNAGELLAIAENTLYEVSKNEYYQLFENEERYTAIYFREELLKFDTFVKKVEKLDYPVTVYVFSWGDDEFTISFEHIDGVTVKTIPQPILKIYKNIYNLG